MKITVLKLRGMALASLPPTRSSSSRLSITKIRIFCSILSTLPAGPRWTVIRSLYLFCVARSAFARMPRADRQRQCRHKPLYWVEFHPTSLRCAFAPLRLCVDSLSVISHESSIGRSPLCELPELRTDRPNSISETASRSQGLLARRQPQRGPQKAVNRNPKPRPASSRNRRLLSCHVEQDRSGPARPPLQR